MMPFLKHFYNFNGCTIVTHIQFNFIIHVTAFRLALIQMTVGTDKVKNVTNAISHIRRAVADQKPKIVALPECFNSPYGTKYFSEYAETIPDGYTTTKLSEIAKELNIYVVGGTIPERDTTDGKTLYNTCTVWSPSGNLIGKHRKVKRFSLFGF